VEDGEDESTAAFPCRRRLRVRHFPEQTILRLVMGARHAGQDATRMVPPVHVRSWRDFRVIAHGTAGPGLSAVSDGRWYA
jgi:hypothetical protein